MANPTTDSFESFAYPSADEDDDADARRAAGEAEFQAEAEAKKADAEQLERENAAQQQLDTAVVQERTRRRAKRIVDVEEHPPITLPPLISMKERQSLPPRVKEWRVSGLQQIGHRVVFAAQFKSGKTTVVTNLVRALLDGCPFLDKFEVSPVQGAVGVLDFEMMDETHGQLDAWYEALKIKHADRLFVDGLRGKAAAFNIIDPEVRTTWVERLRSKNITYLIIDCLRPVLDALGLDEKSDAGVFLVALDQMLTEAGIREALVVHHMGHSSADNPRERSRGDSRILDWPDVNWKAVRLRIDDDASPRFFSAYGRGVDVPEHQLVLNFETRRVAAVPSDRKAVRKETREKEKLDDQQAAARKALSTDEWRSTSDVHERVGGRRPKSVLEDLAEAGVVEHKKGPKNADLWRLTGPAGTASDTPFPVRPAVRPAVCTGLAENALCPDEQEAS